MNEKKKICFQLIYVRKQINQITNQQQNSKKPEGQRPSKTKLLKSLTLDPEVRPLADGRRDPVGGDAEVGTHLEARHLLHGECLPLHDAGCAHTPVHQPVASPRGNRTHAHRTQVSTIKDRTAVDE